MPELLELPKQIETWRKFFEIQPHYLAELHEQVRKGNYWVNIEFTDLALQSPELADMLLEQPEEILKAGQVAIEKMDLPASSDSVVEPIDIRVFNLPAEQTVMIREIRSKHLEKFLQMTGVVRQKSDVRPQVTTAKFECPSCGNIIPVLQLDTKFREPSRCGCGRKGKFKLLSKELVDAQSLTLEEATEELDGGEQPKRMKLLLKRDLVSPMSDKKTNPGSKVTIVGTVKEVPIILHTGGQSIRYDLIIEVNSIEMVQQDFTQINVDPEDEKEIKELSQDPDLFEKFVSSIAPSIYGHEFIKQALMLQLFGGVHKTRDMGIKTRGDIHVLLIGDPGAAKSQMLRRIAAIAPKARYVAGMGASGRGLCVSPHSLIMTNPGGMETIQNVVERRIGSPSEFVPGVWKKENITDVKIQSLSEDFKIHAKHPEAIWKLEAPETVFEVTLASGKRIELTGNTQLFVIENGKTTWKKSSKICADDYIATPRRLVGGDLANQEVVELISSNPVVHDVKPFVKKVTTKLAKKYGTLREAAKQLGIRENSLYHSWVNEKARGNIKLQTLKKISEDVNIVWKPHVRTVSLYNGKKHTIPLYLTKNFLYVCGLIAGDGDMRMSGSTVSVRLSNKNRKLHQVYRDVLRTEFSRSYDVQKGNKARPESTRTSSKLLGEVLFSLGIPLSPKSNKVQMSNLLLHLSNELVSEYVSGLFDADGSVMKDSVELSTCSELLVRQIQLVLLRFGIQARIRKRPPTEGKISGKYDRWVLIVRGSYELEKFRQHIHLRHPRKEKLLENFKSKQSNPNVDIIPGVGQLFKNELQKHKIPLKKVGWHQNFSRGGLQRVLSKTKIDTPLTRELHTLAHSDIFWDRVVHVREKKAMYEHVYDLTVEDSHNFVVDGILVHNTASVVKDDFLGGWALEAGALVLANKGLVCIDELDKMSKEDTSAMHEALEQQQVSIAKANIQATLRCETTVLAAANPKFGRFDPYEIISKQIDLPPTLLNRFDLIFPVRDIPDKTKDDKLASFILNLHQTGETKEGIIEPELIRKYIAYCKQKINPKLSDSAVKEIREYFVKMRGGEDGDEMVIKPIPITARQLEALIRLAEASARMRLSNTVTKRDAQVSIELVHYCLQQIGMDPDTGKIDLDRITTGISASQRSHISMVKEVIQRLEKEVGKAIPIDDVVREAGIKGIDENTAQDVIEKLKRAGDVYSPKHGFISRL